MKLELFKGGSTLWHYMQCLAKNYLEFITLNLILQFSLVVMSSFFSTLYFLH